MYDSLPRIVAIETSGRHGSVAVGRGPDLLASRELPASMRHAIELMPAIRELTAAQGWTPDQIDHVYLSLGPGSFTGLRIAVAIARALAQAAGCKLVGVPSLDVIAQNAPAEFRIVLPILDAKRGQVFSARYERDEHGVLLRTRQPALVDPAAFVADAVARAQEIAATPVAVLGEGVNHHRPALFSEKTAGRVAELDHALWPGQAAIVHRLGYARALANQFDSPATLLPLYIRLPEAEEVFRKKHGLPLE